MTNLLITGGRDYCEYLDANGFPIQLTDERSRVIGIKTKEAAISERRALGFALDFAFKWSGADRVSASDTLGTGRWARVWAGKRGVDVCSPSGSEPFAVVFPGADERAVKILNDNGCDIFEVSA
jgi:hypothetical protein